MICILSLLVFSILGIFSATHRELAKEAFDCVLRRVTLRPCTTGFNEKIQAKLVGKLLNRSVLAAKLINKHFELLSWIFFILILLSTIWSIKGVYNFYLYGSCNGLNQSGFCAFDPTGQNNKVSEVTQSCSTNKPTEKDLTSKGADLSSFQKDEKNGEKQIVFIGCYSCDYTRKAYPLIRKLAKNKNISLIFAHYPVKDTTNFLSSYSYCAYKQDQKKFWDLNKGLG